MYLEDKFLIGNDWLPEVKPDYLTKCLVEKNIDFYIEDWKKLAVQNVSKKDILFAPYCNIPEHKIEEKYPEVTFTKDINLATKFAISDQLLARIYNFKTSVEGNEWWGPESLGNRSYIFREVPTLDIFRYKGWRGQLIKIDKNIKFVYIKDINVNKSYKSGERIISIFEHYPIVRIKPYRAYGYEELSGNFKQVKYVEQLLQAKSSGKIEFIFESTLLESLNADSNVIDKQFYNNLCSMLESENVDEHRLAYEVLANCEIDKSKIYILLILNTYAYELNRLEQEAKRTSNKKIKNKNYKSMLSYLNLKPADLLLNWDTFSGKIVEKCNLSDNDILILKEHLLDKLNKKYNHTNFKIESICLKEK